MILLMSCYGDGNVDRKPAFAAVHIDGNALDLIKSRVQMFKEAQARDESLRTMRFSTVTCRWYSLDTWCKITSNPDADIDTDQEIWILHGNDADVVSKILDANEDIDTTGDQMIVYMFANTRAVIMFDALVEEIDRHAESAMVDVAAIDNAVDLRTQAAQGRVERNTGTGNANG